jgi:hypothetical protein
VEGRPRRADEDALGTSSKPLSDPDDSFELSVSLVWLPSVPDSHSSSLLLPLLLPLSLPLSLLVASV